MLPSLEKEEKVDNLMHFFPGTETQSSLWEAVAFFLESLALHDSMAAEKCFGTGAAGDRPSPQEEERYNYSKCTTAVRIMEFTTTLLSIHPEGGKVGHSCCFVNLRVVLGIGTMQSVLIRSGFCFVRTIHCCRSYLFLKIIKFFIFYFRYPLCE